MDEKRLSKVLKKIDRISSSNNPKEIIDLYHEAGEISRSMDNYDQAIDYFHLELAQARSADIHDDILYCHRFIAECYLYKNQFLTSEKYHLNFLALAKQYAHDERIEQAYTCLANTYWLWLSYLQDDILYEAECDQLPKDLCQRSLDAAENSLLIINKLDYQLEMDIKEKRLVKMKDIEQKRQDLALRRVRSYINIANAISEKYLNGKKDNANLKAFSQYIKNAVEISKKYDLFEELARLHSSISGFYLSFSNSLQYKKEILATMEQAIHYAHLSKNTNEYLSCLYDIAQTLVSFDDYEEAKYHLLKIYRYKKSDHPIKEKATQDLANVQRILTGLEDRYDRETNLRKKMSLAEKCADTYSYLNRPEQSKNYYLKQFKHAQELDLDENQMATIYSSLGSIYQDLKQWQLSIDYFRREMSCRIGLGIGADIEQGYSLCEIIKCEYRLKLDRDSRIRTFKRVLTIARSTNEQSLIRMAVALVFAMKLRDPHIYLNDDLEEFMANIQPPVTEDNYSQILRCANETIESNESPEINYRENRLHLACKEQNSLKKIKHFISTGDDINHPDCHGWTPLHKAVDHKNLDIVRYLLDHKANINARTNNGITPLIIACYNGCLDVIELLLTYAAQTDLRTNNGYTAVDYLMDFERHISSDDQQQFNRLKELLLAAMKKDDPIYSTQRIIQSDFDDKQIVLTNGNYMNNRIHMKNIRTNRNTSTDRRFHHKSKHEKIDISDDPWIIDDFESISKVRKEYPYSPSHTPACKRRCPMIDTDPSSSNEIEILNLDHFDASVSVPPLQFLTPKSTMRSRQTSTTSSVNTTIVLTPPVLSHDINTRIIRCVANSNDRRIEEKKLRIPMLPSDTITNLRYQVLKRLYDNYNIYACFVTLYDREDWELGLSESDTIQLALPADESEIKVIYIEKNPLIVYEEICKEMNLIAYSNIRLILKQFFEKFELSLPRLSLKFEQAKSILKVFENFMFIHSINLSENNLTDDILEQLERLTLDQLKSLNLSKNRLTSNGIEKLFEQKLMNNLLVLDLTDNTDIDSMKISFLRTRFPNLTIYL